MGVKREQPSPLPSATTIKKQRCSSVKRRNISFHCCSLCTHPPGEKHLSILSSSEKTRVQQLRLLLGISDEDEDHDDLIFCPICRLAVTTLFKLREEVEDSESRIQFVLKPRGKTWNLVFLYLSPISNFYFQSITTLILRIVNCCPLRRWHWEGATVPL